MGDENKDVNVTNNSATSQNEETSDQAGGATTTGENNTAGNTERVFTQDEVSRMMAREKHQGRNSVYNELGIDPDDTSAVQMFKAFIEAQKTKEQKQAEIDAKRQREISDMDSKLKVAEAKAVLMQAGVSGDYVDDAVTIALSRVAKDDTLDIETVAKDLKAKYSVWFEKGQTADTQSTGKKGTGKSATGGNSNSTKNDKVTGIGKRLAESRKAQNTSKSFWGN